MGGLIPQSFIDELLARADIVQLIDARVPLRKAGRDYQARCPFHEERTPSFTVSPDKQFYHCFGCGAHGTAIGFLMEHDGMNFPEAVSELAGDLGLEVPREGGEVFVESQDDLYAELARADAFFQRMLREHPQGERAVAYLKERGLDGATAARFGIGFAPPGWDNLLQSGRDDPGAAARMLELGLLIEREQGGMYDRFRDRVMFPIRDRRGRVIGFGGRAFGDEKPKYMNSPESALFHKGRELYGLYEARQASRHPERLLVVEGYMDTVALAQAGIDGAVATLGTSTTPEHLETIYRVAPSVVFCFDGDQAGRKAAWRALEQSLPAQREGRQAAFLFLPEGEDPDSLVRGEGREAFLARLDRARPLSEVLFETLAEQTDLESLDGRARLAEKARPLISRVPDGIYRQLLVERLAELVKMPAEKLSKLVISEPTKERADSISSRKMVSREAPMGPSVVRTALSLLLRSPSLAAQVSDPGRWRGLDLAGVALLVDVLEQLHETPDLTTAALLERWREDAQGRHLFKLLKSDGPDQSENVEQVFDDVMRNLDIRWREARMSELGGRNLSDLTAAEKSELQGLYRSQHEGT